MDFRYRYLIFFAMMLVALIFITGESSAAYYSTSYSVTGKVLQVKKANVLPDYYGGYHVTNTYDPFGNIIGTTTTAKQWGTDNKGRNVFFTSVNGALRSSRFRVGKGDFLWSSSIKRSTATKSIETIIGNFNYKTSFSGYSVYTVNNGKTSKRVTTLNFKQSGKKIATFTDTTIPKYNSEGKLSLVTDTMITSFTNGDWRYSKIFKVYNRDLYYGTINSLDVSGTSREYQWIGSKRAYYTGKISIASGWVQDDGWDLGNYKEVKSSSSSTLLKRLPYEALLYDDTIQRRDVGI